MTYRPKVFGLALLTGLAVMAVPASAATAAQFTSAYPTLLFARATSTSIFIAPKVGSVKCTKMPYEGTEQQLTGPTTELTVHPEYSGCRWGGIFEEQNSVAGCNYVLHAAGTFDIVCASHPIERKVLENGVVVCTVAVDTQSGLASVTYKNVGNYEGKPTSLEATIRLSHVRYTAFGSGCPYQGTFTDGTYSGTTLVTGSDGPVLFTP